MAFSYWPQMQAIFTALLFISGNLSSATRVGNEVQDAAVMMNSSQVPCEAVLVAEGCARLKKFQEPESGNVETISVNDIQNYFMAEPADVIAFASIVLSGGGIRDTILPETTCQNLCEDSVSYLQDILGMISDRNGYVCTSWSETSQCVSYVPVSLEAMHDVAKNLELGGAYVADDFQDPFEDEIFNETDEQDEMVGELPDVPKVGSISYTVPELALHIAHIFGVYPVPPDQTQDTPGSLVEGAEEVENPPAFGQEVPGHQQKIWKQIVPTAEAWLTSAVSLLPLSRDLQKAVIGKDDEETYTAVNKALLDMQQTLSKLEIRVGADNCHADTLAYVIKYNSAKTGKFMRGEKEQDRFIVRVCNKFWGDEYILDPTYKYGTLVHESSHHWGSNDEVHQGAVAYGLAQVLGLAEQDPKKALMNADNFMWLVYFLNLCSGEAANKAPSVDVSKPACELRLAPENAGKAVNVRVHCPRQVKAASLKFIKPDHAYAAPSRSFGTLTADKPNQYSNVGNFALERGVSLHLIYEENCNVWQASATWDGSQKKAPAVILHSLRKSKGGSIIRPPRPIQKPVEVKQQPAQPTQKPIAEVKKQPPKKNEVKPIVTLPIQKPNSHVNEPNNKLIGKGQPAAEKKPPVTRPRPAGKPAEKVDAALYFGHTDTFLTHGGKRFKCCKHSGGAEDPILVDVTVAARAPKKRKVFVKDALGCGAMYGNHFHSYNKPKEMQKKPAVYDGTCFISKMHFKGVTGLGDGFLRNKRQVRSGVEDALSDADCRDSVPGAMKRDVDVVSSFFGSNACWCGEDSKLMGTDVACSTSVSLARYFNPQVLRGKGCWCSA